MSPLAGRASCSCTSVMSGRADRLSQLRGNAAPSKHPFNCNNICITALASCYSKPKVDDYVAGTAPQQLHRQHQPAPAPSLCLPDRCQAHGYARVKDILEAHMPHFRGQVMQHSLPYLTCRGYWTTAGECCINHMIHERLPHLQYPRH